jgi:hypothetical protein
MKARHEMAKKNRANAKETVMGKKHERDQDHANDDAQIDASEAPKGAPHGDRHPEMKRTKKGKLRRFSMDRAFRIACMMVNARVKNCVPICVRTLSSVPGFGGQIIPHASGDETQLERALSEGYAAAHVIPRATEVATVNGPKSDLLPMIVGPLQKHALAVWAIAEILILNGEVHADQVERVMLDFGGRGPGAAGPSPQFIRESAGYALPPGPHDDLWILDKADDGGENCGAPENGKDSGRSRKKRTRRIGRK